MLGDQLVNGDGVSRRSPLPVNGLCIPQISDGRNALVSNKARLSITLRSANLLLDLANLREPAWFKKVYFE